MASARGDLEMYDPKDFLAQGYRPGAPTMEAQMIDAEIAEGVKCRECGGDCHYEAWHKLGSYIALAVCKCGNAEEF